MPPIFLLDYDGTLANTDEAVARCMFDTLAEATGSAPDPAALTEVVGRGLLIGQAFASLLGEAEGARSAALAADYLRRYPDYDRRYAKPFPGTRATLEGLRETGALLAVVTNKMTVNAELSLGHTGLRDLLPVIVGAEPGRPAKPDPRLFDDHVAPLFPGAGRERFIMVGDTEADLGFARAAGLRSAWAMYGFGRRAACEALAPTWRLADISDLLSLPEAG